MKQIPKSQKLPKYTQWRPHPWHGLSTGHQPPIFVNAYIEITPFDGIKYEVDKVSGYLKVDRPQLTSSSPPALYGFIPQTLCGDRVAKLSSKAKCGDLDPLDICVLSERAINRSDVIVPARVIGGLRMIEKGEADDKIIAVLEPDPILANTLEIDQLSKVLLNRLKHYFLTYKLEPDKKSSIQIDEVYNSKVASEIIRASIKDYQAAFSGR